MMNQTGKAEAGTGYAYLLAHMENIACPICGAPDYEKAYEGVACRGNLPLRCVVCAACTHVYLNPRPALKACEEFYKSEDYRRLTRAQENAVDQMWLKYRDEAYWQERLDHGRRLFREYGSNVLRQGDLVFDFGAGDGAWLGGLREMSGCRIDGNEPSSFCVSVVKEKLGIDLMFGSVEALRNEICSRYQGAVKLAIVSGSLQHMVAPMDCLEIARAILKDDGYLYICNHDIFHHYMTASHGRRPRLFRELMTIDHLNYFHEQSYAFMAQRAGFETAGFRMDSAVRSRHMEIFARKSSLPATVPRPPRTAAEIAKKIQTHDALTRKYRSIPERAKRFFRRKLGLTPS